MTKPTDAQLIARAIHNCLISPNVPDSNLEHANVVDVIEHAAYSLNKIAKSITADAAPGTDETGGTITSLTEAVMGITSGLFAIAQSLDRIADAMDQPL